MTYAEFRGCSSFTQAELQAFGRGVLLSDPPPRFGARLPTPPMLMLDRIVDITRRGTRGTIVAERDVDRDDWFFRCHFVGDPVQPGCLGLDAVWQMLGFYCAWNGALGRGRALGCGEVEFSGQIQPHHRLVRYEVDVRRVADLPASGSCLIIGDGTVLADGTPIYSVKRAKVGLFQNLDELNGARQ